MRRLHPQILVLVLILTLGSVATVIGQTVSSTTGAINGKVTDTTGAVLPGVSVSISSQSMQGTRTDVTNPDGVYRFRPDLVVRLVAALDRFSASRPRMMASREPPLRPPITTPTRKRLPRCIELTRLKPEARV